MSSFHFLDHEGGNYQNLPDDINIDQTETKNKDQPEVKNKDQPEVKNKDQTEANNKVQTEVKNKDQTEQKNKDQTEELDGRDDEHRPEQKTEKPIIETIENTTQ